MPESRRRQSLEEYLYGLLAANLPILPYDREAARQFAVDHARLVRIGRSPAYADEKIAALAQTNGLILVTRNVSDFQGFNQLITENWFES